MLRGVLGGCGGPRIASGVVGGCFRGSVMSYPGTAGAAPSPSLDIATLTVVAYPAAGESVLYLGGQEAALARARNRQHKSLTLKRWTSGDPGFVHSFDTVAPWAIGPTDPRRALRSSQARSRTAVRRWCVSQRVDRLLTFTFDDVHLPATLDAGWAIVEGFRRRCAEAGLGPMLLVPEWGDQSGRFHFHGTYSGFIDVDRLRALWGQGFVHYRKMNTVNGESARGRSRRVASYVAGYVVKASAGHGAGGGGRASGPVSAPCPQTPPRGRRRYSIPKGSLPVVVRRECSTVRAAWAEARALCGAALVKVWASEQVESWAGPPTILLAIP